jgi:hypothetical protein
VISSLSCSKTLLSCLLILATAAGTLSETRQLGSRGRDQNVRLADRVGWDAIGRWVRGRPRFMIVNRNKKLRPDSRVNCNRGTIRESWVCKKGMR